MNTKIFCDIAEINQIKKLSDNYIDKKSKSIIFHKFYQDYINKKLMIPIEEKENSLDNELEKLTGIPIEELKKSHSLDLYGYKLKSEKLSKTIIKKLEQTLT